MEEEKQRQQGKKKLAGETKTPAKGSRESREERLAQRLRDNLRRRKEQARRCNS